MAVKKVTKDTKPGYKNLIIEGLKALNNGKGASRVALKKYIKDNHSDVASVSLFDSYFNNAIKKGIDSKEFHFPKGPSGVLKLVKPASTSTTTKAKTTDKKVTKKSTASKASEKKTPAKKTATATTKKVTKPKKDEKKKTTQKKSSAITYREMILTGVLSMNNGKGASRMALKKFIKDKYPTNVEKVVNFDYLVNNAIKKGVESGELSQPSGPSGMVKILKKGKESIKSI